jgi:hypothetical protein
MPSDTETTRQFKAALRKQFPSCKFSITRGGTQVEWTDDEPSPSVGDVEDALLQAGCAGASTFWKGDRRLEVDGHSVWFNRFNATERATYQEDLERRRAEWRQRQQQEQQAEAECAAEARRAASLLWGAQDIPPIPLLEQLNGWVIEQNEKRLPKWKFRLADDLAVQIHPRLTRAHELLLECVALQADNLSVKLFLEPKLLRGQHYWRLGFKLFANASDAAAWTFKPTSAGRGMSCSRAGWIALRQRTIEALRPERFERLQPDLMLSPHCLCCGKGLTDPVSMARWIGPECWGSASTNLPRIFNATPIQEVSL